MCAKPASTAFSRYCRPSYAARAALGDPCTVVAMRAWQVHELGDPIDRMVLGEVDSPVPGSGRLVVDLSLIHI